MMLDNERPSQLEPKPVQSGAGGHSQVPSHLQEVQAELISRQYPAGQHPVADALTTGHSGAAYANYIRNHDALEAEAAR